MNWFPWRIVLSRLSLPLLAVPASYGVYTFSGIFVPEWVAWFNAAAFEMVYIGLAVAPLRHDQTRRADVIAWCAVFVSVVYNWLAGWFSIDHGMQAWFTSGIAAAVLAFVHGAPMAVLAFSVTRLLLHTMAAEDAEERARVTEDTETACNDTPVLQSRMQPAPLLSDTQLRIVQAMQALQTDSAARIAEYCGLAERTVYLHRKNLIDQGILQKTGDAYMLTVDTV